MYFSNKIATFGALVAMPATARRGGGGFRGGGDRDGGRRGDKLGRGPFTNATYVDITCDADFSCDPRGPSEEGFFVCRSYTCSDGETKSRAKCIPSDRSIEGSDECGCCGEDCPVPCDTCPCTTRRGTPGAYILDEDDDEPICVSSKAAMMLTFKKDEVSCLTDCSLAE
ncbi:unnamed protein product [Cylindrotheca closterium]|uniref:Uncharacterized protein n=1 Tax=Cylindrotheca closterium TaxID=2856 RepID=A0AAD2CPX8_9STRA|nr:unnamed protein product [Cylindrotheca closterium]